MFLKVDGEYFCFVDGVVGVGADRDFIVGVIVVCGIGFGRPCCGLGEILACEGCGERCDDAED